VIEANWRRQWQLAALANSSSAAAIIAPILIVVVVVVPHEQFVMNEVKWSYSVQLLLTFAKSLLQETFAHLHTERFAHFFSFSIHKGFAIFSPPPQTPQTPLTNIAHFVFIALGFRVTRRSSQRKRFCIFTTYGRRPTPPPTPSALTLCNLQAGREFSWLLFIPWNAISYSDYVRWLIRYHILQYSSLLCDALTTHGLASALHCAALIVAAQNDVSKSHHLIRIYSSLAWELRLRLHIRILNALGFCST